MRRTTHIHGWQFAQNLLKLDQPLNKNEKQFICNCGAYKIVTLLPKYWSHDMPKISFDDLDFRVVIRRAGGKLTKANMKRLNEMSDRIFRIGDYHRGEQGDITPSRLEYEMTCRVEDCDNEAKEGEEFCDFHLAW